MEITHNKIAESNGKSFMGINLLYMFKGGSHNDTG